MVQLDLLNATIPSDSRTIANYMMWRVTAFSSFFLTEELRKRQLVYATAISGKQEQEPRWKECVDMTSGRWVPRQLAAVCKYLYFAAKD